MKEVCGFGGSHSCSGLLMLTADESLRFTLDGETKIGLRVGAKPMEEQDLGLLSCLQWSAKRCAKSSSASRWYPKQKRTSMYSTYSREIGVDLLAMENIRELSGM